MAKERGKTTEYQRGSATVEAVVGFTAFLFAIFTILGLVNFCRAQMLISAAVDTAAKEMAQYSYFYEMSGMRKLEKKLDNNGTVGKNNINEVIGTVDKLYGSLSGAGEQSAADAAEVQNMLKAGEFDMSTIEKVVDNAKKNADEISDSAAGVADAFKDVAGNPLIYMRSVVAIAASETAEAAKRAIAIPLAKGFVAKHFGSDADAKLEALGIEGGLDSLDFSMTNIFSDKDHQDIELVVFYKVKLIQLFDWVVLEANLSKVSVCRAWLGGDNSEAVTVSYDEQPSLDGDAAEDENDADAEEESGNTEDTEDQSETPDDVDYTNSKWSSGGYDECIPFLYHLGPNGMVISTPESVQRDQPLAFGDSSALVEVDDSVGSLILLDMKQNLQDIRNTLELNDENETQRALVYTVYVPQNMSEEDYDKLEEMLDEVEAALDWYLAMQENGNIAENEKIAENVEYEIQLVRTDDGYDYSNGGGT